MMTSSRVRVLQWSSIFAISALFSVECLALDEARQLELRRLVRDECTQCHGPGRVGGEGPSLLPSDIRIKDKEELISTILNGRASRMPPWYTRLSPEDVRYIVEHILPAEPEP